MIFKRILNLFTNLKKSSKPLNYFVSRLFVNFPFLFKFFYFRRKNYKLRMSSSSIAATLFSNKDHHFGYEEDFLKSLIRKKGCFIDIGANIGHLSIFLKKSFPDMNCISIEANPNTYKILNDNIKLNRLDIKSYNYAVGEKNDVLIDFQDSYADDCNSVIVNKMQNKTNKDLYLIESSKTISIKMKTLDNILDSLNILENINLLKIDTEGYEYFVLKGAEKTLDRTKIIYFEYWDNLSNKYNCTMEDISKLLRRKNFEIFYVPNKSNNFDIKKLKKLKNTDKHSINLNFLAINRTYINFLLNEYYT